MDPADPDAGYVTITFDRRRARAADLPEAILQSGDQAAPLAGLSHAWRSDNA